MTFLHCIPCGNYFTAAFSPSYKKEHPNDPIPYCPHCKSANLEVCTN